MLIMRLKHIIFLVLICITFVLNAQHNTRGPQFNFQKLKPIIQVFGTATYNLDNNHYNYSFGRAHIGLQYQFNKRWSSKIIVDRGRPTSAGIITVTDSAGNLINVENSSIEGAYYTMFLKFASLRWKVNDKLTIEGGAILQNHYITQERFWGLRFISQTFQDLYWHIPSSDLGFIAYYKLNKVISVDAALTNGEGPRKNQDTFGKVKFAAGLNINPSEDFQARIFYHNRQSGEQNAATEQLISVFAGLKLSSKSRIGGEFNYMYNLQNTDGLNSYGCSVYGGYDIAKSIELFVRFDRILYVAPDSKSYANLSNGNTIIGGLVFSPVKGVFLSINYQGRIPDEEKNAPKNQILLSMEYKF